MKIKSNTLISVFCFCLLMVLLFENRAFCAPKPAPRIFNPYDVETPYAGLQFLHPGPKPKKHDRVEPYIPAVINYGLNQALPSNISRGIEMDAGWDQLSGSPTLRLDYFQAIKAWNDKSVFLSPRVSLNGVRENYSLGAGFRHLLTSDTMFGFYAYYDWIRPKRAGGDFLRQAVAGFEFSALPGYFSDLKVSANAYIPTNVRETLVKEGTMLFRESLPEGGDLKVSLLAPTVFPYFDIRLEGQAHSYRASNTNVTGHRTMVSINSRDGMLNANVNYGRDSAWGEQYSLMAGVNLAFDWNSLLKGENPFSAPHKVFDKRYNRKIREGLFTKAVRRHDLPLNRSEIRSTIMANISGETVTFTGGFPDIPNSVVTVQISQSPWRDCMDIPTDEKGSYYGMISLPPGTCKIRLVHKPSGRATEARTIMITDNQEGGPSPLEAAAWQTTPEF